ncbi:5' nucleotidase, NT5C type [Microbacterium sp. oral taxon 186]|nr:hypothetical protein [Microbacterium sp. oral taxon 186]
MRINGPLHISVDIDCTIAALTESFDLQLDARGEEAAGMPRFRDGGFANWDMRAGLTPHQGKIIEAVFTADGFFGDLPPIAGARRVLRELTGLGHHITFASTPYRTSRTSAGDKLAWMRRVHGQTAASRTALVEDKTTLIADILIDDKPNITGYYTPRWRQLLYGEYPYNLHIPGPRLRQWTNAADVLELIRELP